MHRSLLSGSLAVMLSLAFHVASSAEPPAGAATGPGTASPAAPTKGNTAAPEPAFVYRAVVVRVVDARTVLLDIDLGFNTWVHNKAIRLLGVKAPEAEGASPVEGLKSKARLEQLLPAETDVILQSAKDKNDKSGGYFGTLWVDGVEINKVLLSH